MRFTGIIVGTVVAGILLALLGLARLLVPIDEIAEYEVREIDITTVPEPPPPPPEEEPPPDFQPPPPALTQISAVPDPTRVPVPKAELPFDVTTPVDTFFTDVEPAPLPKPVVRSTPKNTTSTPRVTSPKPPPAPRVKSHYSMSELDGKPRLIRHGTARFPSSLRGVNQGTVVLEVELSESGSVRVRRTISATHSQLISAAQRVASSSRFTPPTRNGQRVKAIMRWPITIRK